MAAALLLALAACSSEPKKREAPEDFDPSGGRKPSARTLYSMSKVMIAQSKDSEAEAILTKLVADHPDFMPAYTDLAELYMRNDRPDSAAEVLKRGVEVAPQDAVLQNNLGMCLMMQGRYEEALDSFTAASTGVPKDARTRGNMAAALGMLGRLDEALALYLQLVPAGDAHYNLAVLCEARNDHARAEEEYRIAEQLGTKRPKKAGSSASTRP